MRFEEAKELCAEAGYVLERGREGWFTVTPHRLTGASAFPHWCKTLGDAIAAARRLERERDFRFNGH